MDIEPVAVHATSTDGYPVPDGLQAPIDVFIVQASLSKEAGGPFAHLARVEEVVQNEVASETAAPDIGGGISEHRLTLQGLRFGTSYYIRVKSVARETLGSNATTPSSTHNVSIESAWSEWSDAVAIPCPDGAFCKGPLEGGGVPAEEVVPAKGYFRVPWAPGNLTFAKCSNADNCLGGEAGLERCANGTAGPMCALCEPGFTKAWGAGCRPCASELQQGLYAAAGVVFGAIGLAVLVVNTLKKKGEASDPSVGILKSGMRYFQLASLAASFPLQWPEGLVSLFGFMDATASAASDVFSVECVVGTHFLANSAILFLTPPAVLVMVAAAWVAYEAAFERGVAGRGEEDKGGKLLAHPGPTGTLWLRLEVSALVALTTMFPTLTKGVFKFFQCGAVVGGRSLLVADASIVCGSEEHVWWTSVIAGPALVLYVLGIPALLFGLMWRNAATLEQEGTRERLGFLCEFWFLLWARVCPKVRALKCVR